MTVHYIREDVILSCILSGAYEARLCFSFRFYFLRFPCLAQSFLRPSVLHESVSERDRGRELEANRTTQAAVKTTREQEPVMKRESRQLSA